MLKTHFLEGRRKNNYNTIESKHSPNVSFIFEISVEECMGLLQAQLFKAFAEIDTPHGSKTELIMADDWLKRQPCHIDICWVSNICFNTITGLSCVQITSQIPCKRW